MTNKLQTPIVLLTILATPSVAFAATDSVLATAGTGPWIALAVVGMVRAMLCLGHRAPLEDTDRPSF